MYAFVDETGNTGKNLFDEAQPYYITGAMVTPGDFDATSRQAVAAVARSIGVDHMHAGELGAKKIAQISDPLLRLLKKVNARFFISIVEKKYLLATKVVDHLFDSGENPSVPWHVYNVRTLRLMLVFRIATILDDTLAMLFWDCLMERNEQKCREHLVRFCSLLLERTENLPDQRTREIVENGVQWAIKNPFALRVHTGTRHALLTHMPNMVAFANLLDGLDSIGKSAKRPIRRITHDRQHQFEKSLAAWHDLFKNASAEPIHLPGEIRVLQKVPGSSFETKSDDDSPGIQVIDVLLWLFRSYWQSKSLPVGTATLLRFLLRRSSASDFSFDGVGSLAEEKFNEVMTAELSNEQLAEAKVMIARSEQIRHENMAAFERDGLLPFERRKPS